MARKDRSIAGFGEVAGRQESQAAEPTNSNVNVNININDLIGKEEKKELVGIYFDADVKAVLDRLGKQGGRGAKSSIVNQAVRRLLQEQGLL